MLFPAEYVRVPFADDSLIPIPGRTNATSGTNSTVDDMEYLFLSDIFPTGWAALDYSNFEPGDTVAVFGAGPVGLLAAYSAVLRGANKVYVVDYVQDRLDLAASIGAIPINFRETDPVEQIMASEPNGVDRSLDCVGAEAMNNRLERQQNVILNQMIEVTRPRGGIGIVGEHSTVGNNTAGAPLGSTLEPIYEFPFSQLYMKSLSIRGGSVDPKLYAAQLIDLIASGKARPSFIISALIDMEEVPEYYERFDKREEVKVVIRF
jgi:threonine dehydrogenase-like Zn-dependent dehydrogenase